MTILIDELLLLEGKYKQRILENAAAVQSAHAKMQEGDIDREKLEAVEFAMNRDHTLMAERISMGVVRGHGFDAGKVGADKTVNPHPPSSTEYLFWYKGWCQGKNIMPFSEIPMVELFELDRPVRHFCRNFKLVDFMNAIARRIYVANPQLRISADPRMSPLWEDLHPYLKKYYLIFAAHVLNALMDNSALPTVENIQSPLKVLDSGNSTGIAILGRLYDDVGNGG